MGEYMCEYPCQETLWARVLQPGLLRAMPGAGA